MWPVLAAGKNLQAQYERWQPRAKYKTHLDPTMDDVKKLAISCRRSAKVPVLAIPPAPLLNNLGRYTARNRYVDGSRHVPRTPPVLRRWVAG